LLSAAQVLYTERGDPICQSCATKTQVQKGHEESATTATRFAYGNLLLGLASFGFDPFFLLSTGAIGNCVFTFRRIHTDLGRGEVVRHPTRQKVAAALGAAVAVISILSRVLR
jgi:hypothetical protein